MNILVVNGPNLNLLGLREPDVYGHQSYQDLVNYIQNYANTKDVTVEIYQSNSEGKLIDIIQENYSRFDGLIINPAAYTHYSYALFDCIKAIGIPAIEVHLSDITAREDFRKISVIEPACVSQIYGKGFASYARAIDDLLKRKQSK